MEVFVFLKMLVVRKVNFCQYNVLSKKNAVLAVLACSEKKKTFDTPN